MRRAARNVVKASEHDEQCAVVTWWAWNCTSFGLPPFALIAIPNANKLLRLARNSYALSAYMRAEGLQPGALDLILAVPHDGYSGLWIEMKAGSNKPTESQDKMIEYLKCGYQVRVCIGADAAIHAIKDYLLNKAITRRTV